MGEMQHECIICGAANPGADGIVYHMGEGVGGDAFVCQVAGWGKPPMHTAAQVEEALKDRIHNAAIEAAAKVVERKTPKHYECEDPWFSCPLSDEGCYDERRMEDPECDCRVLTFTEAAAAIRDMKRGE